MSCLSARIPLYNSLKFLLYFVTVFQRDLLRFSLHFVYVFSCQKRMQQAENLFGIIIIFSSTYFLKNLADLSKHISEVGIGSHLWALPRTRLLPSTLLLGLVAGGPLCFPACLHRGGSIVLGWLVRFMCCSLSVNDQMSSIE